MYTINVLSNKEFESLPDGITRGSDITDSLGFADKRTGDAYVRISAVSDLNKYLIDHEFDELVEDESSHEDENGIRHKKFRQAVGNIGAVLGPVAGGFLGGPLGAGIGGAVGGALKGGIGGEQKSWTNALIGAGIGGAGSYLGSKLLGSAGGALSRFGGGGSGASAAQAAYNGPGPYSFGAAQMANPQAYQAATSASAGNPGIFSKLFGGVKNFLTGGGGGGNVDSGQVSGGSLNQQGNVPIGAQVGNGFNVGAGRDRTGSGGGGDSILSGLAGIFKDPKTLLGLGSTAIGLFKGLPDAPDISGITDSLKEASGQQSPLSQQAQGVLSTNLSKTFQPLNDAEIAAATRQIDESEKQAEDQIRDTYRNIRPGTNEFTDSALAKDLQDNRARFAELRADSIAGRTRNAETAFNNQQSINIQQALGIDNQTFNQLAKIAELDINSIMTQLQLDYEQASQFKQTFLDIGQGLLSTQVPNQYFLPAGGV